MNMKKCILARLVSASLAGARADDSYIYWQVDSSLCDFAYATISEYDGTEYLKLEIYNDDTGTGAYKVYALSESDRATGPVYSKFLSSSYAGSLLVELFNSSDERVDNAIVPYSLWQGHTYADLGTSGALPLGVAVPEPSSGLLALLGAGLVALRRRRRAKKA